MPFCGDFWLIEPLPLKNSSPPNTCKPVNLISTALFLRISNKIQVRYIAVRHHYLGRLCEPVSLYVDANGISFAGQQVGERIGAKITGLNLDRRLQIAARKGQRRISDGLPAGRGYRTADGYCPGIRTRPDTPVAGQVRELR